MNSENQNWITENSTKDFRSSFRIKEVLFSEQSDFQKVEVVDTFGFGKMLLNDGMVMAAEADEFIYHEMMVHPAVFLKPQAKTALIIGGGDGGTARELLRHPQIETVTMVEIDELVVKACRKHLPVTAACLDPTNPRLRLLIDDGVKFVEQQKNEEKLFDLIFVDSSDPIGPAAPLFGESFYKNIRAILAPGGLVVSQAESSFIYPKEQQSLLKILASQFESLHLYNFTNMTYPSGLWSFSMACSEPQFEPKTLPESSDLLSWNFRYYSQEIHQACFCLSQYQRDLLYEAKF